MNDNAEDPREETSDDGSTQPPAEEVTAEPRVVEAELVGGPTDDPLAVTALVLGIAGLVSDIGMLICCVFAIGPVLSLGALGVGIFSLLRIKNEPDRYKGQGYAWAGIIMGGVNVVIILLMTVLGFGLAVLFGSIES